MDGSGPVSGPPDLSSFPPAPRGKRGWKNFHGILKGMILYLQKVRAQLKGLGLSWLRGGSGGGLGWAGTAARTRWAPHRRSTSLGRPRRRLS